jgi:hypothetical protein
MTAPQGHVRDRQSMLPQYGLRCSHRIFTFTIELGTYRYTTRNQKRNRNSTHHVARSRCRHPNGRNDPNREHSRLPQRRARHEPIHRRIRERASANRPIAFGRHDVRHRGGRGAHIPASPYASQAADASAPGPTLRAKLSFEYQGREGLESGYVYHVERSGLLPCLMRILA